VHLPKGLVTLINLPWLLKEFFALPQTQKHLSYEKTKNLLLSIESWLFKEKKGSLKVIDQ